MRSLYILFNGLMSTWFRGAAHGRRIYWTIWPFRIAIAASIIGLGALMVRFYGNSEIILSCVSGVSYLWVALAAPHPAKTNDVDKIIGIFKFAIGATATGVIACSIVFNGIQVYGLQGGPLLAAALSACYIILDLVTAIHVLAVNRMLASRHSDYRDLFCDRCGRLTVVGMRHSGSTYQDYGGGRFTRTDHSQMASVCPKCD